MFTFTYKARDDQGRLISGKMDVSSTEELQVRLENCGFFLVESAVQRKGIFEEDIVKKFVPITRRNLYTLTLQLGNIVSTGVPLLTSFNAIIETTKNQKLLDVLKSVQEDLRNGKSLTQAMSKHPHVFSKFYTSMVEMGEASGNLPRMFSALAEYIKKEMEIKNKILSAISYPMVVLVVGTGVVTFLLIAVIPQFVSIFKEGKAALPLPTQILLGLSGIVTNFWYIILGAVISIIFSYRMFVRSDYGRLTVDQIKLKIPVIGKVTKKICVKNFVDGLYLLYSSGLPIISALNIVRSLVSNQELENTVGALCVHMSTGKDLTTYLSLTDFFPPDILAMIRSAEESGTLGDTLTKISEIYNNEVNNSIAGLIQLFEVGVILLMGLGVGFVALAIMFPIMRMGQVIIGR